MFSKPTSCVMHRLRCLCLFSVCICFFLNLYFSAVQFNVVLINACFVLLCLQVVVLFFLFAFSFAVPFYIVMQDVVSYVFCL